MSTVFLALRALPSADPHAAALRVYASFAAAVACVGAPVAPRIVLPLSVARPGTPSTLTAPFRDVDVHHVVRGWEWTSAEGTDYAIYEVSLHPPLPTDLNQRVTVAILRAEEADHVAAEGWDEVEKAEMALAKATTLPEPERMIARRGVILARDKAAVRRRH